MSKIFKSTAIVLAICFVMSSLAIFASAGTTVTWSLQKGPSYPYDSVKTSTVVKTTTGVATVVVSSYSASGGGTTYGYVYNYSNDVILSAKVSIASSGTKKVNYNDAANAKGKTTYLKVTGEADLAPIYTNGTFNPDDV